MAEIENVMKMKNCQIVNCEKLPEEHAPPPLESFRRPGKSPEPDEQGRQRAAAAVRTIHPPNFLARISAPGLVSAEADASAGAGDGSCTLSISGRWAAPAIREIEMK